MNSNYSLVEDVALPSTALTEGTPEFAMLPAFLRVLLGSDGTVSRALKAYFSENIEVQVINNAEFRSDRSHPEINIGPGDHILRRRVTLRGGATGTVYLFADSVIAATGGTLHLRKRLIEDNIGIGELIREERLETYREVLSLRRTKAGEWARYLIVDAGVDVLIRNYRIYMNGQAVIAIQEVFPNSRFQCASTQ
jgi:chorismate-pyruvate lyase